MQLWTTFCPQKICWELTKIASDGRTATSQWLYHKPLIDNALKELRKAGIFGVRLVIFPEEITEDGVDFHWRPIDAALELCYKHDLRVDFCLGPYQYPYYPGLRFPKYILDHITKDTSVVDEDDFLKAYGLRFLHEQLSKFGKERRIRSFYLGNEWPDSNRIEGKLSIKSSVSKKFMLEAAELLKNETTKDIRLNTNIDPAFAKSIAKTFDEFSKILGPRLHLGLDVYPSQEQLGKAPLIKLKRLKHPYKDAVLSAGKISMIQNFFFAEAEAQPWGNGKSWYSLIKNSTSPQVSISNFSSKDLLILFEKYIIPTKINEVSLWGSDFWLAAKQMGVTWPLEQVSALQNN